MDSRIFTPTLALLFALVACNAVSAQPQGARLALVVGVDEYEALPRLRGASLDAAKVAARLKESGYETVILLRTISGGRSPGKADLESALESLASRGGPAGAGAPPLRELTFFFSGHGLGGPAGDMICLSDADPLTGAGMLSVDRDILARLRSLDAELTVVLLDACRDSYGGTGWALQSNEQRTAPGAKSLLILYGARPGSYSFEAPDGSGGFFTKALLAAWDSGRAGLASMLEYIGTALPASSLASVGKPQSLGVGGSFLPSLAYSPALGRGAGASEGLAAELAVKTEPAGASVWIDGRYVGESPLLLETVAAGIRTIVSRHKNLYAEKEILVTGGKAQTVELALREATGRVFFGSERRLLEYSIDGKAFVPMPGEAFLSLPSGLHDLRVLAEGNVYWEGRLDIPVGKTLQVQPSFRPCGILAVRLPSGAALYVKASDGSKDFLFTESGLMKAFPAGEYQATVEEGSYKAWSSAFSIRPGEAFTLAPELEITDLGAKRLLLEELSGRIGAEARLRRGLDAGGAAAFAVSAGSALGGAIAWFAFKDSLESYRSAGLGADFGALRERIARNQAVFKAMSFSALGSGAVGVGLLALGPRPERSRRRMAALEEELGQ